MAAALLSQHATLSYETDSWGLHVAYVHCSKYLSGAGSGGDIADVVAPTEYVDMVAHHRIGEDLKLAASLIPSDSLMRLNSPSAAEREPIFLPASRIEPATISQDGPFLCRLFRATKNEAHPYKLNVIFVATRCDERETIAGRGSSIASIVGHSSN